MLRKPFTLIKIGDIQVRADLIWAFFFGLLFWMLGGSYLPTISPELGASDTWTLALASTAFLAISVAAHELGHSLTAKRLGIPVRAITLHIFGGLSQLEREPTRARDEFLIALAGPAVNLGLSVAFWGLIWAGVANVGLKLTTFGRLLATANLLLGGVNLVPALPLDGGRMIRALVWGKTGDERLGTRVGAALGRLAAALLYGWGTAMILWGDLAIGIWIMLVGWFMQAAVSAAERDLQLRSALAGLVAEDVMITDCPIARPTLTLQQFVNEVVKVTGRRNFPVSGGGPITGVISVRDIATIPLNRWADTTVGMAMTPLPKLPFVPPSMRAVEAFRQMRLRNQDQIVVLDGGSWMGMITRSHLLEQAQIHARPGP